jgi:hypothetical protein
MEWRRAEDVELFSGHQANINKVRLGAVANLGG